MIVARDGRYLPKGGHDHGSNPAGAAVRTAGAELRAAWISERPSLPSRDMRQTQFSGIADRSGVCGYVDQR
jgi:hypothetical protein